MTIDVIRMGISTCPNDTFAMAAILDGRIKSPRFQIDMSLGDISELNEALLDERFDVCKASYAAVAHRPNDWWVLPVGSALGHGNGPLLLSRSSVQTPQPGDVVRCPGQYTTATHLTKRFYPFVELEQAIFSEIMPALIEGKVSYGVCIHEGRFTYKANNLDCVCDLGQRWHDEVGGPLPLGGLFASTRLSDSIIDEVLEMIERSLMMALGEPTSALPMMRKYAQEFDDDVLMKHVDLYVNEETKGLTSVGRRAISQFGPMRFWPSVTR